MKVPNQPKGTEHTPSKRRTLGGKRIPLEQDRATPWEALVAPGPRPTGVQRPFATDAPVLTPVVLTDVTHAPRNAPSRRIRRAAARAAGVAWNS